MTAPTDPPGSAARSAPTGVRRVAVIANAEKLRKRARRDLQEALGAAFDDVTWTMIDKGRKAKPAAKRARKAGCDAVLVAGGDGTVRAAAEALVDTGIPLAVLPSGTANLFVGAMQLPTEPQDVIALMSSGSTRVIDTGVCNGLTFNVMGGAGFDAQMIADAEEGKERLGTLAYVRAGARAARSRRPFHMTLHVDGVQVFDGDATGVLLGNVGTLKGGLEAFPDASPTDGVLDVAVITAAGLRDWASLMIAAARHRQRTTGHAHLWRGTNMTVRFEDRHRFELDGGVKGSAKRLDVEIRPASLTLFAPPPSA